MARCTTYTGLPLDTWAAILGFSPWEFNNCAFPVRRSTQCQDVMFQFPWQKDHLSREEIGEAIAAAESMLAHELLYWPYPRYITGEVQPYPRPHQRQYFGYAGTPRGEWKSIDLNWKRFISGGAFNRTHIGTISGADLARTDEDGDGVLETFTATITDAAIGNITDPTQIALYFEEANRHDEPISELWRIRPVRVTISGNTATIKGHATLLINPEIEYRVNLDALDPATAGNYVTSVECYRVFTDTTSTDAQPYQGVAEWKVIPSCTQNCTFEVKAICLGEDNSVSGQPMVSFGAPGTWPFKDREPDRVNVNYVAGAALQQGNVEPELARMITYLSVSLLANEKCGCERSNRILAKWRQPILRFSDNNGAGAAAFAENNTNFPMTVGGQYAWARVRRMRDVEVVSL